MIHCASISDSVIYGFRDEINLVEGQQVAASSLLRFYSSCKSIEILIVLEVAYVLFLLLANHIFNNMEYYKALVPFIHILWCPKYLPV